MAANMIGVNKSVIGFFHEGAYMEMFNPRIVSRLMPYEAEEGCLSLTGTRKTTRYNLITVRYQDRAFKEKQEVFTGFTAQIIQHELDHLDGIII
jgi:peptide deformylase